MDSGIKGRLRKGGLNERLARARKQPWVVETGQRTDKRLTCGAASSTGFRRARNAFAWDILHHESGDGLGMN